MTIRAAIVGRSAPTAIVLASLLASCATTTVTFTPAAPSAPVCQVEGEHLRALVLWTTDWRADQKDVPQRAAAAEQGIARFFATSRCFADTDIRPIAPDALRQPTSPRCRPTARATTS